MVEPFTARVLEIIKSIPPGKVTSYGRIAAMAGNPRGARQVVRVLHTCSEKYDLPWHRVVDRLGKVPMRGSLYDEYQKSLLVAEGVVVNSCNQIDLQKYLWEGE